MVEFVFVAIPLIMLFFAIIWFGLALNIKQDLTRAAAEGARAAAVALPPGTGQADQRDQTAWDATSGTVNGFLAGGCTRDDVECVVQGPSLCVDFGEPGDGECIAVQIRYSGGMAGNSIPFVGQAIPDEIVVKSVARVNS